MTDAAMEDVRTATVPGALVTDPTGVPRLDGILGGGLPRGALTLVVGPPGSGKTTLAAQMAIAAARTGRRVLVLTVFSEPVTKLVVHLRTLRFFDEQLLGEQFQILSLAQFLPQGLDATADEIRELVRRGRYSFVVLDGFRGARATDPEDLAARRFLYQLGSALGLLQATVVVTTEAEPRDHTLYSEATTADVLLGLNFTLQGLREQRYLEAIKVRGLAKTPGLHAMTLTVAGVALYPRLEAQVAPPPDDGDDVPADDSGETPDTPDEPAARVPFGLAELDALLGGGLTRATSTVVFGSPGAGKTLLALHWALAGVDAGESAVVLGFRETRRQFLQVAESFGQGRRLRAALALGGGLMLLRFAPVELDPDVLATKLLAALDRSGARRLVIDSVSELERTIAEAGTPGRTPGYLAALSEALRGRGVTTLAIRESTHLITSTFDIMADTASVLAENLLLLQHIAYRGRLHRILSAPKMRFSAHDLQLREVTIAPPHGLRVLAPTETAEGVLAGLAARQDLPAGTMAEEHWTQ